MFSKVESGEEGSQIEKSGRESPESDNQEEVRVAVEAKCSNPWYLVKAFALGSITNVTRGKHGIWLGHLPWDQL